MGQDLPQVGVLEKVEHVKPGGTLNKITILELHLRHIKHAWSIQKGVRSAVIHVM